MSLKKNITFVLLEPSRAGNTGAAARAIYNMGFKNLAIVNSSVHLEDEALDFAMKGINVLKKSAVYKTFEEAVSDSSLIVGLTRRRGKKRGLFINFDEGIKTIRERGALNRISLVFGRENSGLSNMETEKCNFLMTIPTGSVSSSINLSQSVLLVAYELSEHKIKSSPGKTIKSVSEKKLDFLFREIENTLLFLGYEKRGNRDLQHSIMRTMKGLFTRNGLTDAEMNMFLGLCREIRKKSEK